MSNLMKDKINSDLETVGVKTNTNHTQNTFYKSRSRRIPEHHKNFSQTYVNDVRSISFSTDFHA